MHNYCFPFAAFRDTCHKDFTQRINGRFLHKATKKFCYTFNNRFCFVGRIYGRCRNGDTNYDNRMDRGSVGQKFEENVRADFNRYKCPSFFNLIITSTQIRGDEIKKIEQLIEKNGGIFRKDIKRSQKKLHVLLVSPAASTSTSENLKMAIKF